MATRESTMTNERLDEFMEAWNAHDAERVVSFFADDCVFHASVGPELMGATYVGKDEVRRGVAAFFERYPGGRFEDATGFVAGDKGASEWTFVAAGPDGAEIATRGCDLFEFDGDLIRTKNAFRKARPA
jgi:ketosteroid isomerase-like protein